MDLTNEKRRAEALDRALNAIHAGDPSKGIQHAFNEGGAPLAELIVLTRRLQLDMEPGVPTRAYVAATRHRLMNVAQARQRARERALQTQSRRARRRQILRPAMAIASVMLAVMMLFTGTGVVYASSQALPGDALYSVKRGIEAARLSLTMSGVGRLGLLNEHLDERLEELRQLSAFGRMDDLQQASQEYQEALQALLDQLGEHSEEELGAAAVNLDRHVLILEALSERLPEAGRKGIDAALESSTHGMQVLEALQNGQHPSEVAPGQTKEGPQGNGPPSDPPGQGPPDDPGGGPPGDGPGRGPPEGRGEGPPDDLPGQGPPSDNPGGGPPGGNPGRGPK